MGHSEGKQQQFTTSDFITVCTKVGYMTHEIGQIWDKSVQAQKCQNFKYMESICVLFVFSCACMPGEQNSQKRKKNFLVQPDISACMKAYICKISCTIYQIWLTRTLGNVKDMSNVFPTKVIAWAIPKVYKQVSVLTHGIHIVVNIFVYFQSRGQNIVQTKLNWKSTSMGIVQSPFSSLSSFAYNEKRQDHWIIGRCSGWLR